MFVLILGLIGYGGMNAWISKVRNNLLCDPNRLTTYQAFFLKPISKQELFNIAQKYNLGVYRFTLGEYVASRYSQASYALGRDGFIKDQISLPYSSSVISILEVGHVTGTDIVPEYNTEEVPGNLLERFDNGEALLLAVQYNEASIKNVMPFFREYDQKGMLGNGQELGHETEQPFGSNFPIEWIHPMKNGTPVSRCEYAN
jgi:hypothetical protein